MMKTVRPVIAVCAVLSVAAAAAGLQEVFRYDGGARMLKSTASDISPEDFEALVAPARGADDPAAAEAFIAARSAAALVGSWTAAGPWVVWDEYSEDAGSFDCLMARVDADEPKVLVLADGPGFEARPSAVEDAEGTLWVAWEEGPAGYGATFRGRDRLWNNVTDDHGPLHTWRRVHLARVSARGQVREVEVPMPAFEDVAALEGRRPGARRLGVFYERPRVALGRQGAIWIAWRHMQQRQMALDAPTKTHVEEGYTVDLRPLHRRGWGDLWRIDVRQRSGDQRLALVPRGFAPDIVMEGGRRDRRAGKARPPRLHSASLPATTVGSPTRDLLGEPRRAVAPARAARERAWIVDRSGEAPRTLVFGDLHRHTDLSLCFPFYDGSLDDAYRYARGPGRLDFVAITDHARDLGRGGALTWPWERSVAAADRHHRPGSFVAFHAYERSQGDTDHNVITLDPDVLRPHTPPLTSFWEEFADAELITIPHATAHRAGRRFSGNVWAKRDDGKRMLAEVYQSFRDVDSSPELRERALGAGHPLGFIASSDHLSTSAAYACVWADGDGEGALDRRPIFEALRARRTYGATDRIELRVRSGKAWMGEELRGEGPHPIDVEVRGAARVAAIRFWTADGLGHVVEGEPERERRVRWDWEPAEDGAFGWCYVEIEQVDGGKAWGSPFFVNVDRGWEADGTR